MPTIKALVAELRALRDMLWCDEGIPDAEPCDVRLQVRDGQWTLHFGDASYDQDHRGVWGCGSVAGTDTVKALTDTARELIGQVREEMAMADDGPHGRVV